MLPDLSALRLGRSSTGTHHGSAARRARAERAEQESAPGDLGDDLLALVLSMIAFKDPERARACEEARAACTTSRAFRRVCNTHEWVWAAWCETIFASPDASDRDTRRGEGLIYDTFFDKDHPRESFEAMCEASAVAYVTRELFLLACYNRYLNELDGRVKILKILLDPVMHTYKDSTQEGRRHLQALADELEDARRSIETHEPGRDRTRQLLVSSKLRPVFDAMKNRSPIFRSLFDAIFPHAWKFVFSADGLPSAATPSGFGQRTFVLEKVTGVAHVLGTYVVCLEKLESTRTLLVEAYKPEADETEMTEEAYVAEVKARVVASLGSARATPIQARLKEKFLALASVLRTDEDTYHLHSSYARLYAMFLHLFALRLTVAVAVYEVLRPTANLSRWLRGYASRTDFYKELDGYVHADDADLSVWDNMLEDEEEDEEGTPQSETPP